MKIDKDAAPFTALTAVPAGIALLTGRTRLAAGLAAVSAAVTAFFRDPERYPDLPVDIDPDLVLAPADGKVMHAGPAEPAIAPAGEWQQVSIFLSLLDVHINRAPYGGTITNLTYSPGKYLAAFKDESATENERTEITVTRLVNGAQRTVVFRQIVGLLARRVVTRVGLGESITSGQRIGLMKFGSRMDIFVPPGVPLLVRKGDRVVAGESTLARWPAADGIAASA